MNNESDNISGGLSISRLAIGELVKPSKKAREVNRVVEILGSNDITALKELQIKYKKLAEKLTLNT